MSGRLHGGQCTMPMNEEHGLVVVSGGFCPSPILKVSFPKATGTFKGSGDRY